jgi:hypothetical protein
MPEAEWGRVAESTANSELWQSMRKNLQDLLPETLAALRREIMRSPETRNLPGSTVPGYFVRKSPHLGAGRAPQGMMGTVDVEF